MKLLKKYFNCLLISCVCFFSGGLWALTVNKKCGDGKVAVRLFVNKKENLIQYVLFYKTEKNQKTMIYKADPGLIINVACIQDKTKNHLVLFQELCGGNGCPEDVYGIFDPIQQKVLFNPTDWPNGNSKEVDSLLGFSFLKTDAPLYFCCSNERRKLRNLNSIQ